MCNRICLHQAARQPTASSSRGDHTEGRTNGASCRSRTAVGFVLSVVVLPSNETKTAPSKDARGPCNQLQAVLRVSCAEGVPTDDSTPASVTSPTGPFRLIASRRSPQCARGPDRPSSGCLRLLRERREPRSERRVASSRGQNPQGV